MEGKNSIESPVHVYGGQPQAVGRMSAASQIITACIIVSLFLSGCGKKAEVVAKESDTVILTVLAGQSTSDAGMEDMMDGETLSRCQAGVGMCGLGREL